MHSPFVFDFIKHVLNNNKNYQPPTDINALRKQLLKDKTTIAIKDLGAGSRTSTDKQKTIAQIAGSTLKPEKYARLMFRLVKHYQSKTMLELGTSLGITTAYLSAANPDSFITTIEGNETIARKATENWQTLGYHNIHSITGNFDEVLPGYLQTASAIDLVYIDGNHRYKPTIDYFNLVLSNIHQDSIIVFDDIHWSAEMERAWEEIKEHPQVQYSIDIFFLGFVFFKKEFKVKQHFCIRF